MFFDFLFPYDSDYYKFKNRIEKNINEILKIILEADKKYKVIRDYKFNEDINELRIYLFTTDDEIIINKKKDIITEYYKIIKRKI